MGRGVGGWYAFAKRVAPLNGMKGIAEFAAGLTPITTRAGYSGRCQCVSLRSVTHKGSNCGGTPPTQTVPRHCQKKITQTASRPGLRVQGSVKDTDDSIRMDPYDQLKAHCFLAEFHA